MIKFTDEFRVLLLYLLGLLAFEARKVTKLLSTWQAFL
jgi:hypothetical protein